MKIYKGSHAFIRLVDLYSPSSSSILACSLLHAFAPRRYLDLPSSQHPSQVPKPQPRPARVVGIIVPAEVSSTRCEHASCCIGCVSVMCTYFARSWCMAGQHEAFRYGTSPDPSRLPRAAGYVELLSVGRGAVPTYTLDSWIPSFCPHNFSSPLSISLHHRCRGQ